MSQIWGVSADGGYMYSDELSDELRMKIQPQIRYRQHSDAKDGLDKGYNTGSKFHWDVYSDVADQGGTLEEQEEMAETKFQISQGELTVTEYGNSVNKLAALFSSAMEQLCSVVIGFSVTAFA